MENATAKKNWKAKNKKKQQNTMYGSKLSSAHIILSPFIHRYTHNICCLSECILSINTFFLRASVYWLPLAEPFSSYLNIRYTQQNGFKAFLFTIEYFIYQWNLGPWRMRHPNYTNYDHKNGFVCSSLVKREREIRTEVCVWLCTGMSITDYGIDR